jgi:paraquat-inducible protein B
MWRWISSAMPSRPSWPHRQGMDVLPTIPGDLEELQGVLQRIARKLDKVPFDSIGQELDGTIKELHAT